MRAYVRTYIAHIFFPIPFCNCFRILLLTVYPKKQDVGLVYTGIGSGDTIFGIVCNITDSYILLPQVMMQKSCINGQIQLPNGCVLSWCVIFLVWCSEPDSHWRIFHFSIVFISKHLVVYPVYIHCIICLNFINEAIRLTCKNFKFIHCGV